MGRTGTRPGSKGRNWPEGERGTKKAGWRLTPATLAAVDAAAEQMHETASATAEALLAVGLRHLTEVRAELFARAQAAPEKKTTCGTCALGTQCIDRVGARLWCKER